jgi:hypothetical protein
MSSSTVSPIFIKVAVAGLSASVLDRFVLGEQDMTQNIYFGVSTGAGVGIGSYIASLTPALLPDNPDMNYTGLGVMQRSFEVLGGLAGGIAVDKYLSKEDNSSLVSKVGVVLLSDFIAEYVKDYITSAPLQFLA